MENIFKTDNEFFSFVEKRKEIEERLNVITRIYSETVKSLTKFFGDVTEWQIIGDKIEIVRESYNATSNDSYRIVLNSEILFMDIIELVE